MADEPKLGSISFQEPKTYSPVLQEQKLGGVSFQETKIYDLRPVRNKAFLGGISFQERIVKPDVIIGEPIFI